MSTFTSRNAFAHANAAPEFFWERRAKALEEYKDNIERMALDIVLHGSRRPVKDADLRIVQRLCRWVEDCIVEGVAAAAAARICGADQEEEEAAYNTALADYPRFEWN